MYRPGFCYDDIAKKVIEIYLDYGLDYFPVDPKVVCDKMCIKLLPYSNYPEDDRELFVKKSIYGFCIPIKFAPVILFNDSLKDLHSEGTIRTTIFHEIKHIVYEETDETPDDDDLAEYFAKYFMCPIPYLITQDICDIGDIVDIFHVSFEMATYIQQNIRNRKARYGNKIFDYEKPLVEFLVPEYIIHNS